MPSILQALVPPVVAATVLLAAGPALAVTLATPLVGVNAGQLIDCVVTNVGTKEAKLSVRLFNAGGTVAAAFNDCGATLGAGQTCQLLPTVNAQVGCEVKASGKIRSQIDVFDTTASNRLVVVVPLTK
jgi:hypothetical protein